MPRKLSTTQALDGLLEKLEPAVANAFRLAMASWRRAVDVQALINALKANNLDAAASAMHLDPVALNPLLDAIENAYEVSGKSMSGMFPTFRSASGARYNISFNSRDPVAAEWLRDNSARLITDTTKFQRAAIRNALVIGRQTGSAPSTIALDIVGRVGTDGRRQGGVIGLSLPQTNALASAKSELLSTDAAQLRNYLNRQLRDKRFDRYVQAALEGSAIPADVQIKMIVGYSNKLLKLRGDVIAATETLPALHAAQDESVRQAVAARALKQEQVRAFWDDLADNKVRHSHAVLGKAPSIPFDGVFVSELGSRMKFPGDRSLGAELQDIIGCRCRKRIAITF